MTERHLREALNAKSFWNDVMSVKTITDLLDKPECAEQPKRAFCPFCKQTITEDETCASVGCPVQGDNPTVRYE